MVSICDWKIKGTGFESSGRAKFYHAIINISKRIDEKQLISKRRKLFNNFYFKEYILKIYIHPRLHLFTSVNGVVFSDSECCTKSPWFDPDFRQIFSSNIFQ